MPAQLAKLGWHNDALWAIDVFTDPLGVAKAFAEKLQLPEQAGYLDYDDHDRHNYG